MTSSVLILTRSSARAAAIVAHKYAEAFIWRGIALGSSLACSILAARILGPEKIGISALTVVFSTQAVLLVSLNLDGHLIRLFKSTRPGRERDVLVSSVLWQRLLLTIVLSIVVAALLYSRLLSGELIVPWLAGVATSGFLSTSANWLLQALGQTRLQIRGLAIQNGIAAICISLMLDRRSPAGSDLALIAGAATISFAHGWYYACKMGEIQLLSPSILFTRLSCYMRAMWAGRWLFVSGVVIYIYTAAEQPMIGWLRGTEDLGLYRPAVQVGNAVAAFTGIVPMVLYPQLIELARRPSEFYGQLMRRFATMARIAAFGCIVTVVIVLISFEVVYGRDYGAAKFACVLLVTAKFVALANSVTVWGLRADGLDGKVLAVLIAASLVAVAANAVVIRRWGINGGAAVNVLCELLVCAGTFALAKRHYSNCANNA